MSRRVKPLAWEAAGTLDHFAKGCGVTYSACRNGTLLWDAHAGRSAIARSLPTLEAAKAACQADHEARVLAMLEPEPAPAGHVRREVLEDILRDLLEIQQDLETPHFLSVPRLRLAYNIATSLLKKYESLP